MTVIKEKKPTPKQVVEEEYAIYRGDCIDVLKRIPDESVGMSVYSPPFADLYSYSDDDRDMGNCRSYDDFFTHYRYLVDHLYRVMMPGRIVAVHCMDLPTHKSKGEEIGMRDFPGDLIRCHSEGGFIFHCRICVWKDPLISATRTKALGLAHKQIIKDSAICRTGIADYVLAFRKPGDNPKPIPHAEGLTEYCGARSVPSKYDRYINWKGLQKKNKRSHWIWQQYASPVWFDIRQTKVLPFRQARDEDDQRHVCVLQTDVIERCLTLWSAKGDVVLTPFMGVGSEVHTAVKCGRKGVGIELKPRYFRQSMRNMKALVEKKRRENQ